MPVSGNEETGVEKSAGQFSGCDAGGIPLKKRKYFSVCRSPPRSEEPYSIINEEIELHRKESSSTSQASSLSNASIAGAPIKKRKFILEGGSHVQESDPLRKEHSGTSQGSTVSTSSSGHSDTYGNPVSEARKASSSDVIDANMVQSNSCPLNPKMGEPNLATQASTLDVMDSNKKVILNESYEKKLELQMVNRIPELFLSAKEGVALNNDEDLCKQNMQETSKQEGSIVPESTSLSLSLKEHLFPSIEGQKIGGISQKIEKGEPVSLELSLSKEERSPHSLNSVIKAPSDTTHVHSNRANWDLNITMDAWDEPGTDANSAKPSIDSPKVAGNVFDEKQFIYSTGKVSPADGLSLKQTNRGESQNKAFVASPGLYGQHYKCVGSHNVSLTSYLPQYAEEPSRLSVKQNSGSAIPTAVPTAVPSVSLASVVASAGDLHTSRFRLVKSEPFFDENLRRDTREANSVSVRSLNSVAVKKEFVHHSNAESSKSSSVSNLSIVDPICIRTEPGHKTAENKMDQLGSELLHEPDNCSTVAMAVTLESTRMSAEKAHPPGKPLCSAEFTSSEKCARAEGVTLDKVSQRFCADVEQVPLESVVAPLGDHDIDLSYSGMKDSSMPTNEENGDNHDSCILNLVNKPPPEPQVNGENCASDEEKITLSAGFMEDNCYGSDYESDGNHAVTVAVDTEQRYVDDDDYEDGEVREPLDHSTVKDTICEVREVEHPHSGNYENKLMEKGVVSGDCHLLSHGLENDSKTAIHCQISSGEVDIGMHERHLNVIDKNVCLQESVVDNKSDDGKRPVIILQKEQPDISERNDVSKAQEMEDQAIIGWIGLDNQRADEIGKTTNTVRQSDLYLPQIEASANPDDATKDASNCGNQGRIIDLSRAASSSSPSKTRPIPGRSLPSLSGRDLLSDTLDGDKFRGRDEVYIDGPRRYFRERHQDMSPRNSRFSYGRGRGRSNSRLDTFRGDWESDREFSGEFYNGPSQFRGPRPNKYASAMVDDDLEYNNVAHDGSYVGNGRIGRKPLNDGSYIAPRRRSPGPMGHRIPRTMSPNSRCIGGDSSDMVGMRHSEKFMRGFQEDTLDSMYTRPQPYEGMDGRFTRGGRSFSSIQRRPPPRIRSKSPVRSRSRTPGTWSSPRRRSPRRRSPDGYSGHPDMTRRRSPLYRTDRMRSPDRPVFNGERGVRRHGSPSYMSRPSNDARDIDSARDHGHPRSVINNRSPTGRILIRNRRFDAADPRDRVDNDDDYFAGPVHSGGRMAELSEGNGEERRRYGDRRGRGGPVRSFRPPYNNGNGNENFHINAEEGPRQYRFCSDDSDFHERGNIREREFDRRMKGRATNIPPRRTRNMDEQDENFRHGGGGSSGGGGGQAWNDDNFDDVSRVKRKRF